MRLLSKLLLPKLSLTLLFILIANFSAASEGLRTVALTGRPTPISLDINFNRFERDTVVLNDLGQVAFVSRIGVANTTALFSEGGGNGLALVAQGGEQVPGGPTGESFTFFTHADPVINNNGFIAFRASVSGRDILDGGVFRGTTADDLERLAQEGEAAPGTGTTFSNRGFSEPSITNDGTVYFTGHILRVGSPLYSQEPGGPLSLVERGGTSLPELNTNIFGAVSDLVVNRLGDIALGVSFFQEDSTPENNRGLGRWDVDGSLQVVAREGWPLPGAGSEAKLGEDFSLIRLNDSGDVAFRSDVTGPGLTDQNDQGIFRFRDGLGLDVVARGGDVAPGLGPGVSFGSASASLELSGPILNNRGDVAFTVNLVGAGVDDGNDSAIFVDDDQGLRVLAREGDAVVGIENTQYARFQSTTPLLLNGNGQAAFQTGLMGPDITDENASAIFAQYLGGNLHLIARTGDTLNVSDNPEMPDHRTVSRLDIAWDESRPGKGFNELGQLAFFARFTDGSEGIFVSDLVAVPEPTTALLLTFAVLTAAARRKIRSS